MNQPLRRLKRTATMRYIKSQIHTRFTRSGNGQGKRQHQHLMTTKNLSWTQPQLCHSTPKRQSACRSAYKRSPIRSLRPNHSRSWIFPRNFCSTYSHISGQATSSDFNASIAPPIPSYRRTKPLSRERLSGPATLFWQNAFLFQWHSQPSTQNTTPPSSRPNDKTSSPSTRNPTSTSNPSIRSISAPA